MTEKPIASPCVSICQMDSTSGLCIGCLRTLDEIAVWSGASDELRLRILDNVAERRASGIQGNPASADKKQR